MTIHPLPGGFDTFPFFVTDASGNTLQPVTCFAPGSEIYGQGEKADCLYQVEFGAVRVYRLLADGRRQIAAFHMAGEVFGFETDSTHHFFAEAIGTTGIRILRLAAAGDVSQALLPLALQSLVRAQEHPDQYQGLQLRVCGWNVNFTELSRKEQDMYIRRARNIAE